MFEIFIRRPILSGVISVVIVFLGLLAITSLPITQFPDIVPPSVTVTARYTWRLPWNVLSMVCPE